MCFVILMKNMEDTPMRLGGSMFSTMDLITLD